MEVMRLNLLESALVKIQPMQPSMPASILKTPAHCHFHLLCLRAKCRARKQPMISEKPEKENGNELINGLINVIGLRNSPVPFLK